MAQYWVQAAFQPPVNTANAEDVYVTLQPPAGVSIIIKRFRYSTGSSPSDIYHRIRVRRTSTANTGGTTAAGTIRARRDDAPNSVTSALVKSASGQTTPGTTVDLLFDTTCIHRAGIEWNARDWKDCFETGVNERIVFTVAINATGASNNFFEVEWVE